MMTWEKRVEEPLFPVKVTPRQATRTLPGAILGGRVKANIARVQDTVLSVLSAPLGEKLKTLVDEIKEHMTERENYNKARVEGIKRKIEESGAGRVGGVLR